MRALEIATGTSRMTKTWKNKTINWDDLATRLSQVHRTPETMTEYRKMGRDKQSQVKDVGGFVGGYCEGGNRSHTVSRSVLCLDADFAEKGLWRFWVENYGFASVVYSTHKHTPEKPRLRLVVPLSRDVTPDEYQAVARKVASYIGIDQFDDTSYQPQRLMYWPSCSIDGEFYYKRHDGAWLNPDDVLSEYRDWRDVSAWPMSSRVTEVVKREAKKQQDPLSKPGLIGAFCRAYSIHDAVEAFVPDYVPCDTPGRYTYAPGSTAAGVVVYDDKFTFSHHATDPASGVLCNAWDLVRLHRFGALDEDVDPGTRVDRLPSYLNMCSFASLDLAVQTQASADRLAALADDFDDVNQQGLRLKLTEKGAPQQTIENAVEVLEHDPSFAGALAYNEMTHQIVAVKGLPWRKVKGESQWTDADDAALRLYMERTHGLTGRDRIFDAVQVVSGRHAFHPVRDFLDGCTWDGVPRVERLLVDYLGAADTEYTRAVTRKTLCAAVARIYTPGCKFDYMLTIRGRQGLGKSSIIARLGGRWFSDSFGTMQGKEAYEQVQGVWLVEVGELAGMRKAEAETIKLYISKQSDRFRPAYGRRMQEFPRQCIFIGTTNESQFLRDTTGNRRFWVVDTPDVPQHSWDELTPELVSLIWGEAVQMWKAGEQLFLPAKLEAAADAVRASYEEENPTAGIVSEYLDRLLPDGWQDMSLYDRRQWLESGAEGVERRHTVCTIELWAEALGRNPDRLDRYAVKELRDIMAHLKNWQHMGGAVRTVKPYGRQRYYRRQE